MSTRSLGFFEKIANLTGTLYRHQSSQFPRRMAIWRAVWKHELGPPKQADWPAAKADWKRLAKAIESGAFRKLSVKEGLVYTAVGLEILAWFFVGEMIGRMNVFGYLVSSNYVSTDTKKRVVAAKAEAAKKLENLQ